MAKRKLPGQSEGVVFNIINTVIMVVIVAIVLFPFLNVLAISFNASADSTRGGFFIFPRQPTMQNYATIFGFGNIPNAFLISVLRTAIGTIVGLIACSMVAFALSRKDYQARRFMSRFMVITLYVSGGLIPTYLLMLNLGLMNNFLVYVLPGMVSVWNIFLIRSYMDTMPFELQESAKMDGANDFIIYARIILPLCKPVLATIALFIAVGQWNSWFDTYIYAGSEPKLSTLQYELMKVLQSTNSGNDAAYGNDVLKMMNQISPDSIKMAITVVTILPIIMVYPFLQRYFIRGMTLGAVKG